jgi:hypothetical protein
MNQETRDKRATTQQEGERKKARTTKEPLKGIMCMLHKQQEMMPRRAMMETRQAGNLMAPKLQDKFGSGGKQKVVGLHTSRKL